MSPRSRIKWVDVVETVKDVFSGMWTLRRTLIVIAVGWALIILAVITQWYWFLALAFVWLFVVIFYGWVEDTARERELDEAFEARAREWAEYRDEIRREIEESKDVD